ncbi:Demethylsterigmatocystin 6-O-methyltransferase [Cytospora mali]|uniref:Demethylsterigmatocystin 6-O-methyltransferase n=1 Tax=Cytospora mali TaxID=578113 RepID=A0A194VYR2_CYTMA|nr:Demethylsterigmatocystin 6-O-methyltransferase [Valsa mali]
MAANVDPVLSQLQQLSALVQDSIAAYSVEARAVSNGAKEGSLPSRSLFNTQRTLLAASGLLTELVSDPSSRLLEVSSQYFESRALHIAADQRLADVLAKSERQPDVGVDLETLAGISGIEYRKLGRVLRCLCSIHIFKEVRPDRFANNRISAVLVGNEPLRAYILMFASDYLPRILTDAVEGPSYNVDCTPWQHAVGTKKSRWEWLEESTSVNCLLKGSDLEEGKPGGSNAYPGPFGVVLKTSTEGRLPDDKVHRPEHEIFGLAMLGGGRVFGQAHLYDFPWASLGNATVVDVGGGVGGFCLQLSHLYPDLNFVLQDRGPVLKQAATAIWPKENPSAIRQGRVRFAPHNFFDPNPEKGADIYWLRYILHDWADDYCVRILSSIKASMGPKSRILICDQVMNTTLGSDELQPAPAPLPANWGYYTRYSHQRDLAMMSIINGIERKPSEFRALAESAGLKLNKIWDCRSQVGLVELVLPENAL